MKSSHMKRSPAPDDVVLRLADAIGISLSGCSAAQRPLSEH